jgi:hypothetical protein
VPRSLAGGRIVSFAVPEARRGPAPPPPRRPRSGRGPQHPRPPEGRSRAERRAAEANRSRPMQIVAAASMLALLVAAAFFFFFFRGGGDDNDGDGGGGKNKQNQITISDLELTVGGVYQANAGPAVQFPPEGQTAVTDTVGAYLQGGMIDPVTEGEVPEELTQYFDAGTAARLAGPDRAVLFDEDLPELSGSFTPTAQPIIITALSDGTGAFVLATAAVNYEATAETEDGEVKIVRQMELTLLPEGGLWKITGYDVILVRDGPGIQSTTTTAAA